MNRTVFFAELRKPGTVPFGKALSQGEVGGIESILDAAAGLPISYVAYLLATAYHETGGKMAPNRENMNYSTAGRIRAVWPVRFPTTGAAQPFVKNPKGLANKVYNGRLGNRPGSDDGWDFRGGGQAHTTGRDNYEKVKRATGIDVVTHPDKILDPKVSAVALVQASVEGWYTGKKLGDYLPGNYVEARRVINGTDEASKIAGYARGFERALTAAGWRITPFRVEGAQLYLENSLVNFEAEKFVVETNKATITDAQIGSINVTPARSPTFIDNLIAAITRLFRSK